MNLFFEKTNKKKLCFIIAATTFVRLLLSLNCSALGITLYNLKIESYSQLVVMSLLLLVTAIVLSAFASEFLKQLGEGNLPIIALLLTDSLFLFSHISIPKAVIVIMMLLCFCCEFKQAPMPLRAFAVIFTALISTLLIPESVLGTGAFLLLFYTANNLEKLKEKKSGIIVPALMASALAVGYILNKKLTAFLSQDNIIQKLFLNIEDYSWSDDNWPRFAIGIIPNIVVTVLFFAYIFKHSPRKAKTDEKRISAAFDVTVILYILSVVGFIVLKDPITVIAVNLIAPFAMLMLVTKNVKAAKEAISKANVFLNEHIYLFAVLFAIMFLLSFCLGENLNMMDSFYLLINWVH